LAIAIAESKARSSAAEIGFTYSARHLVCYSGTWLPCLINSLIDRIHTLHKVHKMKGNGGVPPSICLHVLPLNTDWISIKFGIGYLN
jgi:hypothetical protein